MRGGGPVVLQRPTPPINTQRDLRDPNAMRDPNAPAQRTTQHSLAQAAALRPPATGEAQLGMSVDQATLCACLVDAHLALQIEAGASPASLVLAKSTLAALAKFIPVDQMPDNASIAMPAGTAWSQIVGQGARPALGQPAIPAPTVPSIAERTSDTRGNGGIEIDLPRGPVAK